MKYVYWGLIALAVLAVIILLVCLWRRRRRSRAAKRVRCECTEEKIRKLDDALSVFGFAYCRDCDCIVADGDPWQRDMGYCAEYDEAAPAMHILTDCEPIYFRYDGRDWLLELWKGQYGCAAGAEIGLYYQEGDGGKKPEKLFYRCADDGSRLLMHFSLWENGRRLLERCGLHWWLTGFLPGKCVKAGELTMKVCIEFPETGMRSAFCRGLQRAGYRPKEICAEGNRVSFCFDRPRSAQPSRFGRCYRFLIGKKNALYCRWYRRATEPFGSTLDRITFLGYCFPALYRILIRLGVRAGRRKPKKCRCRRHKGGC